MNSIYFKYTLICYDKIGGGRMNIIIYHQDKDLQNQLTNILHDIQPYSHIDSFTSSDELLDYVKYHSPQVIFISFEEQNGQGCFLATQLKKLLPKSNLIAMASQPRYEIEAMKLRISGYILGSTITKETIEQELNDLRYL